MKFTHTIILVLALICTTLLTSCQQQNHQSSEAEQLVNSLLAKTAKIIEKKYKIKPIGSGAAMPGGPIRELTLCFTTKNQRIKNELRLLLLSCANELLDQVTRNREIQPFLYNAPFSLKEIEIIIHNTTTDGTEVYDPEILVARFSQGTLIYRTTALDNPLRYKSSVTETYEEALKATLANP